MKALCCAGVYSCMSLLNFVIRVDEAKLVASLSQVDQCWYGIVLKEFDDDNTFIHIFKNEETLVVEHS